MSRERSPRRGRIALRLYVGLAFAFLIAPLLVVFPISLSSSEYLQFPPPGLSLRWYQQYFGSPAWIDATVRSVVIGTAVAYAVVRGRSPLLRIAERAVLAPIVVPSIVISVSIYGVFASLRLVGTWYAVALAHTLLALPFVVVVVAAGLRAVDPALERAAQGLGASRLGAVWHATLPQIRPSLITAALFAFVISFDELVIALFLTGAQATLPKRMFENITFAIDPTIAAVSVVKIMVVLAALLLSGVVVRRIAPAAPA
jgi:putative spermidine/putrescine transport system permease protein